MYEKIIHLENVCIVKPYKPIPIRFDIYEYLDFVPECDVYIFNENNKDKNLDKDLEVTL